MECDERKRLLVEYERAVLEASDAAMALSEVAGTTPLSDYRVLLEHLAKTEAEASRALVAFDKHLVKHRGAAITK